MPILIPTAPLPPTTTEPRTVAFYGNQKIGKTETVAALGRLPGGLLHVDVDPTIGTAFVQTRRVVITCQEDYVELCSRLPGEWKKAPFRWLAIDLLNDLEPFAERNALIDYKKFPLSASFGGKSVLELPKGLGYGFMRDAMFDLIKPVWGNNWWTTIFLVHSRAKFVSETVTAVSADAASDELDLTGKIRQLICSRVDAVGHFTRNTAGALQLSFKTPEKVICGLRARYLHNKVITFSYPTKPEEWQAVWPETWNQPARVAAPTAAPTTPLAQTPPALVQPAAPVAPAAPAKVPVAPAPATKPVATPTVPATPTSVKPQ